MITDTLAIFIIIIICNYISVGCPCNTNYTA